MYAASPRALFRHDPRRPAGEAPAWVAAWSEHRLAAGVPLRDGEGSLWMFLEDRPGKASRWDGKEWSHFDVPFSTRAVGRMIADDRGRLLVAMRSYPEGCFEVGAEGTRRFENLHSLLAAAVAGGARRFFPEPSIRGCVVDEAGGIWFAYQGYSAVHFFDGARWDELPLREPVYDLFESGEYGIGIRTQSGRFFAYDRGQLVELPISIEGRGAWLLGTAGLFPYAEKAARSGDFLAVMRSPDGKVRIAGPSGEALPDVHSILPGFRAGHWSRFPRRPAYRFLGGKAIPCDFRGSPLLDRQDSIEAILEDRRGNLWLDAGEYFGTRTVFLRRTESLEIRAAELPGRVRRSVAVESEVSFAGEPLPEAPLFWRLDGGDWRGGEPRAARIEFPGAGTYEVEISGMGRLGELTPMSLRWTVEVEVPLPETLAAGEAKATCDDLVWEIPARAVPSEPGREAALAVRLDGSEWAPAYRGRAFLFAGKSPGVHRLEVAATAEGGAIDPSPLEFEVRFEPEYPAILSRRLDRIHEMAPAEAEAALFELRAAGREMAPPLRDRIEAARRATKELPLLEVLIATIERELEDGGRR